MVTKEALEEQFQVLGCSGIEDAVLEKCQALCIKYDIDEDTFITTWVDFSLSIYNDYDPTLSRILKFEEEKLKEKCTQPETKISEDSTSAAQIENLINPEVESNDILEIYGINTGSTAKQTKRTRSPEVEAQSQDGKLRAIDSTFLPATYAPQSNTPSRYPSSATKGKILLQLGKEVLSWGKKSDYDVEVGKSSNPHVPEDAIYMFSTLAQQKDILTFLCEKAGKRLCHLWYKSKKTDVPYVKDIMTKRQSRFRTWGRISSGQSKKIDPLNVFIEGCKQQILTSDGTASSTAISLDLSKASVYSIFPGQIVALECTNPVGNALHATELFVKAYAPKSDAPRLKNDLNIVIAGGPFTSSENLHYEALWDLMEQVSNDEPHLLILIGPLVDCNHSEISKALIKDSFQRFFEKLVGNIMQYVKGKCTQVVLVASNKDAHHEPVYPTPQYFVSKGKVVEGSAKLHLMPDPCTLDLDGLTVGITSVDIIKHLGSEEVSNSYGMDRISRLTDHLLCQHSFYPLYPSSLDVNLDIDLWGKYAFFDRQPHLMVLPSDLRFYCKAINESLVLNPERLTKHTYAKLCVRPASDGHWSVKDNVSCEIVKV